MTSDHGESFGEHGFSRHPNGLYLEEIRVPLIVWGPGRVPAGIRVRQPVTNAAVGATVLELIGISGEMLPGPPLGRLWTTPIPEHWPYPVSELARFPGDLPAAINQGGLQSLITPQWHYIVHSRFGAELYNWSEDPKETADLAGRREFAAVLTELSASLDRMLRQRARKTGPPLPPAAAGSATNQSSSIHP